MGVTQQDVGLAIDCDDESGTPRWVIYRSRTEPAGHGFAVLGDANATTKGKAKTWTDTTDTASSQTSRAAFRSELGAQFGSGATDWYDALSDAEQQRLWKAANRARLGAVFG